MLYDVVCKTFRKLLSVFEFPGEIATTDATAAVHKMG